VFHVVLILSAFLIAALFVIIPIIYLFARVLTTYFACKAVKKEITGRGAEMTKGMYFALIKPLTPLVTVSAFFIAGDGDLFSYCLMAAFVFNITVFVLNRDLLRKSKTAKIYAGIHIFCDAALLTLLTVLLAVSR
jgi:hypothetical protein